LVDDSLSEIERGGAPVPFLILYGGELVFAFLGVRIARWMWRSRERVLALWRARHAAAGPGPSPPPEGTPSPRPVALRRLGPAARAGFRRAA
jgi:hypothetical protein